GTTIQLLDTQYRMHEAIAGFSNKWFYEGLMKTPQRGSDSSFHLTFIDTAGAGYFEERRENGVSFYNRGELNIAKELLDKSELSTIDTAFISPYAAQVGIANDLLSSRGVRTSTIDGFQGQEMENIIISLVRSNDEGAIGFLKDYRRMNVAMTRAKEQLFIIGDSSTIGSDSFYHELLSYIEAHGNYRSVWEFDVMLL
ncbi:MAG: ATP-binding protein, partial [Ginsengibacter sp.]